MYWHHVHLLPYILNQLWQVGTTHERLQMLWMNFFRTPTLPALPLICHIEGKVSVEVSLPRGESPTTLPLQTITAQDPGLMNCFPPSERSISLPNSPPTLWNAWFPPPHMTCLIFSSLLWLSISPPWNQLLTQMVPFLISWHQNPMALPLGISHTVWTNSPWSWSQTTASPSPTPFKSA